MGMHRIGPKWSVRNELPPSAERPEPPQATTPSREQPTLNNSLVSHIRR
jgi:hypothetical protein